MRKLCSVKVQLTFHWKTLVWKVWLLSKSWVFLMNHDQPLIKWWMWLQNEDVDQKSGSLTVCWPQLTFWPIQLIFNHLSNCLRKLDLWGLKLDMENLWNIWGGPKTIGGVRSPSSSENCQTLVWVDWLGESLSDQLLRNPWAWMYGMSWEIGGQILGYDSCPCSIFLYWKG